MGKNMRILADKRNKKLFASILILTLVFIIGEAFLVLSRVHYAEICMMGLSLIVAGSIVFMVYRFLKESDRIMEQATVVMNQFESGANDIRIPADEEGEIYRLFHEVNKLMEISSAQLEIEKQSKSFLKDTISDISHQLKTPLAALQIYNGILQDDSVDDETLRKFTNLSEQELDRISTLVGNLLNIAKLDAKTMPLNKKEENLSEIISDIKERFSFRAESENKLMELIGDKDIILLCDRSWLTEAIANIVKNALDHTKAGEHIWVEWKQLNQITQIIITDSGSGIHPDDLYHIFKRFYRSRHSNDVRGIGLGLPLAKAIIEAHDGTVEVRSSLGEGAKFTINLLNPTKL